MIPREELESRLTSEFGYPVRGALLIAEKIANLQPTLQEAFEQWWYRGDIPVLEVEGYTVDRLIAEQSMNPIAAILTLDWLLREPEKAKASLKRGHDKVVVRK